MTAVPTLWLPPGDQWDTTQLRDLLGGYLTPSGYSFTHYEDEEIDTPGAAVIIPGRYDGAEERVSKAIADLDWALVMVTGDEEASFAWQAVSHPNVRFWFMHPRAGAGYPDGSRYIGSGYAPWLRDLLARIPHPDRPIRATFAGQVNHQRRSDLVEAMADLEMSICKPSPGFTQGLSHEDYAKSLAMSACIPAPSGPHTPDSFRAFEALEAGSVPLLDGKCPAYDPEGEFWPMIFGPSFPMPIVDEWSDVGKYIDWAVEGGQELRNRCFAFWQLWKRTMGTWLADDLTALGAPPSPSVGELITVVIPTSPIPSHPSTEIIDQTIESVRARLPESEILVMLDGVREEDSDLADAYEEFQRRLLFKMNHEWRRVVPVRFDAHHHQAAMLRHTLDHVRTPTVLFVEADTPLRPDLEIPWEGMVERILEGDLNMIRLHHEANVHPEHRHLMVGGRYTQATVPLWKTVQFSARPHLASAAWYRQILSTWFSPNARTMIEDRMYGVIDGVREAEGAARAWPLFRIALYAPDGDMRRTDHTDGREGRPKHEETFTW